MSRTNKRIHQRRKSLRQKRGGSEKLLEVDYDSLPLKLEIMANHDVKWTIMEINEFRDKNRKERTELMNELVKDTNKLQGFKNKFLQKLNGTEENYKKQMEIEFDIFFEQYRTLSNQFDKLDKLALNIIKQKNSRVGHNSDLTGQILDFARKK